MITLIDEAEFALRLGLGLLVPLVAAALGGTLGGGLLSRWLGLPDAGLVVLARGALVLLAGWWFAADGAALVVDETARAWSSLAAIGQGRAR